MYLRVSSYYLLCYVTDVCVKQGLHWCLFSNILTTYLSHTVMTLHTGQKTFYLYVVQIVGNVSVGKRVFLEWRILNKENVLFWVPLSPFWLERDGDKRE